MWWRWWFGDYGSLMDWNYKPVTYNCINLLLINNRKEHHHFEKSIDLQIYTIGSQSKTGTTYEQPSDHKHLLIQRWKCNQMLAGLKKGLMPKLWFLCRVIRLYSIGSLNWTQEKIPGLLMESWWVFAIVLQAPNHSGHSFTAYRPRTANSFIVFKSWATSSSLPKKLMFLQTFFFFTTWFVC